MPYIANTPEQQEAMLRQIGRSMEELFSDIPPDLRSPGLNIPPGLTEQEVRNRLASIAARNKVDLISFLGGGFYDHFIPAAVPALVSRSEFYTAYTPYQPEISQGV
ncbi:MAG: glycine dehydrogenase, partial [Planctomycetota bacterium]|nr:glycine dehydrogenase [Planctomycetota bacterium]